MHVYEDESLACLHQLAADVDYLTRQLQRAAQFAVGHAADCVRRGLDAVERIEERLAELPKYLA